jgi:hypothetical protein
LIQIKMALAGPKQPKRYSASQRASGNHQSQVVAFWCFIESAMQRNFSFNTGCANRLT